MAGEAKALFFDTKVASRLEDGSRWERSVVPALSAYRDEHGDLVPSEESSKN